jgi:phage recombination protein Bet
MQDNQQTAIIPRPSALALMAQSLGVDQTKLMENLKATCFKGASNEEFQTLVIVANQYQLNPFLKELYAFPKKGGGVVPLVGVDGWIKIANREPDYDGMDVEIFGDGDKPTHGTCTIYHKSRSHPTVVTEYYKECYRNTDPWNQMPRRQMRNKTIIQAVRVAFGVSGIHDEDEAEDVGMRDVTPRAQIDPNVNRLAPPEATPPKDRKQRQPKPEAAPEPQPDPPADDMMIATYIGAVKSQSPEGVAPAWSAWAVRLMTSDETPLDCETYSKTIGAKIDALEADCKVRVKITERAGKRALLTELERIEP